MQITVKIQAPVLNGRNTVVQWTIYELQRELDGKGPKATSRKGTDDNQDGDEYFELEIRENEYDQNIAKFTVAMDDITYTNIDGERTDSDSWRSVWFKLAVAAEAEMEADRGRWVEKHIELSGNYIVVPSDRDGSGISY